MNNAETTFSNGMTLLMIALIAIVLTVAFFIRRQIKRSQYGDEYIRWGTAQEKKKRYKDAVMCYLTAEEVYRENGDDEGRARAFFLAGMLESRCGNHKEAQNYFRKAEPIARKASKPEDLAFLLLNMGDTEAELGKKEKAKACYSDAAEVYGKHGDQEGVLFAQDKLIEIETEEN